MLHEKGRDEVLHLKLTDGIHSLVLYETNKAINSTSPLTMSYYGSPHINMTSFPKCFMYQQLSDFNLLCMVSISLTAE